MAETQTASAPAASHRKGAQLNFFDIPEMMPGAQPGANPAERERFEQRCRELHQECEQEEREIAAERRAASGAGRETEIQAMFPTLDADLIRGILADASSPQVAIDTLLALVTAVNDVGIPEGQPPVATPPPRDLGVNSEEYFPSLLDSSGWQVPGRAQLDANESCDTPEYAARAKTGVSAPEPPRAPRAPQGAWGKPRREKKAEEYAEPEYQPTDYDMRHSAGQKRVQRQTLFGRGAGRGAGARAKNQDVQDPDEEDAEDDGVEVD